MWNAAITTPRRWERLHEWVMGAVKPARASVQHAVPQRELAGPTLEAISVLQDAGFPVDVYRRDGVIVAGTIRPGGRHLKAYACDARQAVLALADRVDIRLPTEAR